MQFNPWWFSGQEDLTRYFFDQLGRIFSTKLGEYGKKLAKQVGTFAELVAKVPDPRFKAGGEIIGRVFKRSPKDVIKLKESIAGTLKKQDKRILIVVDDIDKLAPHETKQLFLLIKAVADFPNVIYLLAFDRNIVTEAFDQSHEKGQAYLEKIVQASFVVPPPEKFALFQFLRSKLTEIIGELPRDLYDLSFLGQRGYLPLIAEFINTPRDVVRFTNMLNVTFASAQGEVDDADFVAIEAIRVFFPDLYLYIRDNEGFLLGYGYRTTDEFGNLSELLSENRTRPANEMHLTNYSKSCSRTLPQEYLHHIKIDGEKNSKYAVRPYLTHIFGSMCLRLVFQITLYRICWAKHQKSSEFAKELLEFAQQDTTEYVDRVAVLFHRLSDYVDQISQEDGDIASVVEALFQVGDKLLAISKPYEKSGDPGYRYMFIFIYELVMKLGDEKTTIRGTLSSDSERRRGMESTACNRKNLASTREIRI